MGYGPQSRLNFLPENRTDFIFARIGEELGLAGAGSIIILYGLMVGRMVQLSFRASDPYAKVVAAGGAIAGRRLDALPLAVPAVVLFAQFVLIGAGKPDEYGRFGVFYECALVIGTACMLNWLICRLRLVGATAAATVCAVCAWSSGGYLHSLHADATHRGSRDMAARFLAENLADLGVAQ